MERHRKARLAREAAGVAGKPLLVVGGPWGTNPLRRVFRVPSHECGDICLDINPAACEGCPALVEADIRQIPFGDGHFGAALASHVLEHLPTVEDCEQAIRELYRVADQVFVASPSKAHILSWLHPGHHLWIRQEEDGIFVESR